MCLAEKIPHTIFKAIHKYKNARNGPGFYFCRVSVNDVSKEIKRLKTTKPIQITNIPVKILKEDTDIFPAYIL